MTRVKGLIAMALWLAAFPAVAGDLNVQGSIYKPACEPAQWSVTATALRTEAAGRSEKQLESLAHTWLCGKGEAALGTLLRAAPAKVTVVSEGTGQESSRTREPKEEALSLREGEAWEASVDNQPPDVVLSVWTNEACMESLSFRFVSGNWMVVGRGGACD